MSFQREREDLVIHGHRLVAEGLCVGTSGNLSIRCDDVVVLTPSGIPYDRLQPESMCVVSLDGEVVDAPSPPSSETPMHLSVYRSTRAKAVVHTHSPYATVLSTVVSELPAIHYVIAGLGGSVRVAPYATFGSRELAENMARGLEGRTAVILQNHGTITYGNTLEHAASRAITLEWLATLYWRAKLFGEPHILEDADIDQVREQARVRGYRREEAPA